MKAAVGQRRAKFLVKERNSRAPWIPLPERSRHIALHHIQSVRGLHLKQIITKLVDAILSSRQLESCQDCFMNLFGRPTTHPGTSVKQDLHQTDRLDLIPLPGKGKRVVVGDHAILGVAQNSSQVLGFRQRPPLAVSSSCLGLVLTSPACPVLLGSSQFVPSFSLTAVNRNFLLGRNRNFSLGRDRQLAGSRSPNPV